MGLTPKLAFSVWMSVQLCLEPAPSGVAMCHHPKPSIPCHSEQFLSWAQHQSTHTQEFWCVSSAASPFSLTTYHRLPPTVSIAFPVTYVAPVPRAFPSERRKHARHLGGTVAREPMWLLLCVGGWGEERLQVPGAIMVSDQILVASPILQASEWPRCLHHSSVTTKCWRLSVQAGRSDNWLCIVESELSFGFFFN